MQSMEASDPDAPDLFAIGQHVLVVGLQGRPELNDRVAQVLTPVHDGRFPVRLVDGENEQVRIKPTNLRRTDRSPEEGKVIGDKVMRYGEWFDIQVVLDKSMNDGEDAGEEFAALSAAEQADVLSGRKRVHQRQLPTSQEPPL